MKIAIPVNENKSETSICVSFGRAPYFMLHDVEGKTTKYIANTAAEAQGGAPYIPIGGKSSAGEMGLAG